MQWDCDHEIKLSFVKCHAGLWKPPGNRSALVNWFAPHVCVHIRIWSTVNKPPLYPWKCGDFFAACQMPSEGKFLLKINLKLLLLISQTPLAWNSLKSPDGLLWCLAFFHTVSFLSSEDYSSLASGEKMENNHYPRSESTGLAYINIDGNLACFLLSTVL